MTVSVRDVKLINAMDVKQINEALAAGSIDAPGLFPHLEELQEQAYVFKIRFGLDSLPESPGIILVRGARQYGKSTWLEKELRATIEIFGPGSAYYLNGDTIADLRGFIEEVRVLVSGFSSGAEVRRLFIDEITSIRNWQQGLKALRDSGELRSVLVVTTGSKASDLRRGTERLPGRKGRLSRSDYLFTPISYGELCRVCGEVLGRQTLTAYILSGGSPVACNELAVRKRIPEFAISMTRDWIYGECALAGRDRASLLNVLSAILRFGGSPLGQAKLAREAGLANNTVADGYIELLADLLCVGRAYAWDASRNIRLPKRPCKVHFVNTLAAVACDPRNLRTLEDFHLMAPEIQGRWYEWVVAQELWRRAAIRGEAFPENMFFWKSKEHELDFVIDSDRFIEVKRGKTGPLDFAWFHRVFPKGRLTVVGSSRFETDHVAGVTLEDFLTAE